MVLARPRPRRSTRDVLGDVFRQHGGAWSVPLVMLVEWLGGEGHRWTKRLSAGDMQRAWMEGRDRELTSVDVEKTSNWEPPAGAISGMSRRRGGGSRLAASRPPEYPVGRSGTPDARASPLLVAEAGRCERWSLAGRDAGETGHGGPSVSLPLIARRESEVSP